MFDPISKQNPAYPSKYYEKIIVAISDMIAQGILKPGDMLPSERELAEQFQLSRVPVREALKILEFLGMVSYVPGKGIFVRKLEISSLLSKIFFGLSVTPDTIRQLFAIRLLIEPYAAGQAALYAIPEELEKIRGALEEANGTSVVNYSLDFHTAVISASHNSLLLEIYTFLYSLLNLVRKRSKIENRYKTDPLRFHSEIYNCICAKDSEGAQRLMREHLQHEKVYLEDMISDSTHPTTNT